MSPLNIVKSIAVIGFLAVIPKAASALELNYKDNSWEVNPIRTEVDRVFVRSDFNFSDLAKTRLLGRTANHKAAVLDNETLVTVAKISSEISRPTQEAELVIENGWATKFRPSQDGQALDVYDLVKNLGSQNSAAIDLPVIVSSPNTKLSSTNDLGINELVAVGESDFSGSTKNRVTNVTVGAAKFNGLILKPGEEFSFNRYLGEVDAANGFVPEIVIKREGLVPEYGGGLCQVSSTTFRAAMNAGLKITERKNHSFAVRYYAPQGTDATIYGPILDFKFINDLPSHLLVKTRIEGTKLYFEFYGTKDDRKVELDGPYQYDKKPDGSMKAVWTKRVTKNGVTDEQVFRSNYVPAALFPRVATTESKPSAPAGTPAPAPASTPTPTQTN